MRHWFYRLPPTLTILLEILAGIASVAIVPLIGLLSGRTKIVFIGIPTCSWIVLAVTGVLVKCAFVLFEELLFRGALMSQFRQ
jgi:hypothetical protein